MKKMIVVFLERADSVLDWVTGGFSLGCRLGLAQRSAALDEEWGTEVWKP